MDEKPSLDRLLLDPGSLPERIVRLLPEECCRRYAALPVGLEGHTLTIAIPNPSNVFALDDIKFLTGFQVKALPAPEEAIRAAIDKIFGPRARAGDDSLPDLADGTPDDLSSLSEIGLEDDNALAVEETGDTGEGGATGPANVADGFDESGSADEAPVVKLVNVLLADAIAKGASDIHIEPVRSGLRVRYRIDGLLLEAMTVPLKMQMSVTSRLKILARCDIAERRLPQDGAIDLKIAGRTVHLKVFILPTGTGERAVIRVVDKGSLALDLDRLGFSPADLERIERAIHQPSGLVLVTGPKGSGAKSTLYSLLARLNGPETCILTAENPIEYGFDGIGQVQVKEELGYTYGAALSAFAEQDPDVVMIQELRDAEVARAAVQMALDSCLVLTSVAAEDAAGGLAKLAELGVEPTLLGTAASLVIAQQGIRKLCDRCKVAYTPSRDQLEKSRTWSAARRSAAGKQAAGTVTLYSRGGCQSCSGTGYKGRLLVYEILEISERVREAILTGARRSDIRTIAVEEGLTTMAENALARALEGATPLEECLRVPV